MSVVAALARNLLYLTFGFTLFLLGLGTWLRVSHAHLPPPEVSVGTYQKGSDFLRTFTSPVSVGFSEGDLEESSDVCKKEWQALLELDFTRYGAFADRATLQFQLTKPDQVLEQLHTLAVNAHCDVAPAPFGLLRESMQAFHVACSGLPTKAGEVAQDSPYDLCLQNSLRYRFAIAGTAYRAFPLAQISGIPLLMNLFFAEGLREDRSHARLVGILNRLAALDPGNYPVAKDLVQVAYAHWKTVLSPAADIQGREFFQSALRQAEALGGNDPDLVALRLREAILLGNTTLAEERAEAAIQQGKDSLGRYYLAWAYYLAGEREKAQEILPQVLLSKVSDHSVYAMVAWNRLGQEDPGKTREVFLEPGTAFEVSFQVPDGKTVGAVGFELLPDRTAGPNPDPDIRQARDQATQVTVAKGQCRKEAEAAPPDQAVETWRQCFRRSLSAMQASE